MNVFLSEPHLFFLVWVVTFGLVGLFVRWWFINQKRQWDKEQQARIRNTMLSRVAAQSPISVMLTNPEGDIEYVNPFFEETYGYSLKEMVGKNPRVLSAGKTSQEEYQRMWATLGAGGTWSGELLNRKKSGEELWEFVSISPVYDDADELCGYVALKDDLSEKKAKEAQLIATTYYDSVTGLPNRVLAMDRLSQALLQARRHDKKVLLVFFDLDHFKKINDLIGFEDGNVLLKSLSERLRACVRSTDTVARYNADEFLLVLQDVPNSIVAEQLVRNVMSVLDKTFVVSGQEFSLSASLGASLFPDDAGDAYTLLQRAEQAMEQSKQSGGGSFRFFTATTNLMATQRMVMEHGLRMAMIRKELSVVFQPIVDVSSGKVVSAEALMRWKSPALGNVPPDQFIELAECIGLIGTLGEWVMESACRYLRAWQDAGYAIPKVAVNVSPLQFQSPHFFETVQRVLENTGVAPSCLEIEITEYATIKEENEAIVLDTFHRLRELGVGFSVDDFGTGYSSLSYLKRYPFDTLKIDRSFVQDLAVNQESRMLVSTMITMGHGLGLYVIGEGVETQAQLRFLQEQECDWVQGYYYAKPMTPSEFSDYLRQRFEVPHTSREAHLETPSLPTRALLPEPGKTCLLNDEPSNTSLVKQG